MAESTIEAERRFTGSDAESVAAFRLPVYVVCTFAAILINFTLGKDMAWDTLDYHLYAGFSALNDRFGQDYFAAGPQSYFNPYVYAPFYYLVNAGLPALAIGTILAAMHSVILWISFELGVRVSPTNDIRNRLMIGICAAIFALINPILLQQIGSCFADITTSELVLAGWLLLVSAMQTPKISTVIGAGSVLGMATALKLTNAVHAVSAIAMLVVLPLDWHKKLRHSLIYGISLFMGFAVVAAPWSYRLEHVFGNPMFPLLNNVFRSPEFISEPLRHLRFVPATLSEALWRPFQIMDPVRMVHEELRAPDSRYAILIVLLLGLLAQWVRRPRTASSQHAPRTRLTVSTRVLIALCLGLATDWILWLCNSGNGRYFLPMACVAAVVSMGLLFRLFATQPKVLSYFLAAMAIVQAVQLWMGTDYRWNGTAWGGQWFDIQMPAKLRRDANLYLTVGSQANSFLAPFLSRDSGLINFSGGYSLGPEGANGARINALMQKYSPNIRVLVSGAKLYEDEMMRVPRRTEIDAALQRFNLRTDMSDCTTITVHGLNPNVEIRIKTAVPLEPQVPGTSYMVSCHLTPGNPYTPEQIAGKRTAELVLDRLEEACPYLFQPRHLRTEDDGDSWRRLYVNSDLAAWVSHGWVKFENPVGNSQLAFLGRESDWAKAPLKVDCGRRDGIYYAKVVDPHDNSVSP